jgi:hypothetical protein
MQGREVRPGVSAAQVWSRKVGGPHVHRFYGSTTGWSAGQRWGEFWVYFAHTTGGDE